MPHRPNSNVLTAAVSRSPPGTVTASDCESALTTSDIYTELSFHRIQGIREVTLLGTNAVRDGYGSSTSLQTVRSMLDERLHKIHGSHESTSLQSNHYPTFLARKKSA